MAEKYKRVIADKKSQANRLMNKDQLTKCNLAIHSASTASAAAGAVPIPVADAIPITAAQVTMVLALGKVFDAKISESAAKGLIGAAASTFVGRSLIKLIPIVGWGVSAVVAAGVTEAIGWTIAVDLAKDAKIRWEKEHNTTTNSAPNANPAEPAANEQDERSGPEPTEDWNEVLAKRAEEFLSGEKKRADHEDEFSTLLSDIEKVLNSLPRNHILRDMYDKLSLIIE